MTFINISHCRYFKNIDTKYLKYFQVYYSHITSSVRKQNYFKLLFYWQCYYQKGQYLLELLDQSSLKLDNPILASCSSLSRVYGCMTNNNGVWIGCLDLLTPSLQPLVIAIPHNQSSWTAKDSLRSLSRSTTDFLNWPLRHLFSAFLEELDSTSNPQMTGCSVDCLQDNPSARIPRKIRIKMRVYWPVT
jgi:hypothetical protein